MTTPNQSACGVEFYGLICTSQAGHNGGHLHRADKAIGAEVERRWQEMLADEAAGNLLIVDLGDSL